MIESLNDHIRALIEYIGDDPNREGLLRTPERVASSYKEIFWGYEADISNLFTTFQDDTSDEIILLKDIPFCSWCEHHMLPFSGVSHVAYLPHHRVIGISKLARILGAFCARLQIQERITSQVTSALDEYLKPKGSACILEAEHSCMSCRGVNKKCKMVTSSMTGIFREQGRVRAELLSLIRY